MFDKNNHLECVLRSHNIENDETLMTAYRSKRNSIREDLKLKYNNEIHKILHSGSYKKRTAVNIKFDMDLVVPFKNTTSKSLQDIFNELFDYYDRDYRKADNTLLEVKKQKVAIGLTFSVNHQLLDLDIVPGREINDYNKEGNLNLFVNDTMGIYNKSSYIKTNVQKQIDNILSNSNCREIIQLLKVWKRRTNQQTKSFILELITVRALSNYSGLEDLWSRLSHTITFIRDNITSVRLVDPGNSNNIVSDALHDFEKQQISDSMKWMLIDIESNENSIERYFPKNPDYPCEQGKGSVYIVSNEKKPERLNTEDFG